MSPRKPGPGEAENGAGTAADPAAAKRALIVKRAAELFDAKGFHRVNMSEIAHAVEIQKPTLYHYFNSKDDILFGIHEEFFDPALAHAEQAAELEPREALVELMRYMLELHDTHPGHLRVVFEHHRELEEPHQTTMRSKRDRYQKLVERVVARGVATGEFRDIDTPLTTMAIFGLCNWSYQWYRPGLMSAREIGEFMADLLLSGLVAT